MVTTVQGNERMIEEGTNGPGRWWNILRIVGWSVAALMLLFPVVAMQFTEEVNWGPEDFLVAAVLLGGSGLLFEMVIRRSSDDAYRTAALLALATTFLLILEQRRRGLCGSGANTANVLYVAMVAIPFIGGAVSRLKPRGMCITMILTAAVQAAITVFAFVAGLVSEEESSVIVAISAVFILLWIGSAVLFQAAEERVRAWGRHDELRTPAHVAGPVRIVVAPHRDRSGSDELHDHR
ncbi:MAG: hypothetical protein IPG10_19025 [Flavobacteriales bacterium]|nr:hypothetical protein [Flavobacteriales bacterium]